MKKLVLLITIVLLSVSTVAAYTFPDFFNPGQTFVPTSARSEGMGGGGIATSRGMDSLYLNPANLAHQKFALSLPTITVTTYNVKSVIDQEIIQNAMDGNAGADTATDYLETISAKEGELLTTDIQTGFSGGGFGLTLNIQEKLHHQGTGVDTNLVAEVNAGAGIGIGLNFSLIKDMLSIDAGAVVRPTYKAYTQKIGAPGLISTIFEEEEGEETDIAQSLLGGNQLVAGYAVPVDVGVNINGPAGLKLSAVARNLNGSYTMNRYTEAGTWLNEMTELAEVDPVYEGTETDPEGITVEVPWTLDLGLGWTPLQGGLAKLLRPTLSVDLVDVITLSEEASADPDAIWDHLIAGAEIKLLSMVDVRAGLNQGYLSLGAGFDLLILHVDAAYYWREFGANIGDKPVDALTVRFNLGIDG